VKLRLTATDWTTLNVIDFGDGNLQTFEVDGLVLNAEILPMLCGTSAADG
jgi:hypothetical protein